ncbi:MAG: formate dehydrogenase accessory protein FdhE [Thermofilaceae archaeon]|nr:formate dehydrogenase accessory protein FdhE [Thermofilaceae archaeon]MCX8179762.1 formate dehydrogenase accessory protein FdhE [Thermofilaceae archaeon]MDW8004289.1 formate dehydrogenase accessory protein FdhE [Thermofilaceae archaeon]
MSIREKARLVRGDVPVDDSTFEVFINLLEVQAGLKDAYMPTVERANFEAAREAVETGRPAASGTGVWLREDEIAYGVRSIASLILEGVPSESHHVAGVLEAVEQGRLELKGVAELMLKGDMRGAERVAEKAGVDPTALSSLVAWALQPAFTSLSVRLRNYIDLSGWSSGRCPICGSYTSLSYIDKKGVFHLKCQFCGTEWDYPAGKCLFCGNDEQELISLVDLGEGKPLNLGVCHVCGNYWKLVDERLMELDIPREIYDLWTIVLDAIARRLLK